MKKINAKVEIIPLSIEHKTAIKSLNLEWLQRYFKVEPKDELVRANAFKL